VGDEREKEFVGLLGQEQELLEGDEPSRDATRLRSDLGVGGSGLL
jgi:hypothetical protein